MGEVFSRPLASDWLRLSGEPHESISGLRRKTLRHVVVAFQWDDVRR